VLNHGLQEKDKLRRSAVLFAWSNFREDIMHRKQFSCFSIESLIGRSVDGRQSRWTQSTDVGDSSRTDRQSSSCHQVVACSSSGVERTWTTTAHNSRVLHAFEADSSQRQRTWRSAASLDDRTIADWNHRWTMPTMIAAAQSFLSTNDSRTSLPSPRFTSGAYV